MVWAPNPSSTPPPPIHTRMWAAGPLNSGQPCQWPSGDHGTPGAQAVTMEIMQSPGKCSTHGDCEVPGKRQSPRRSWGRTVPMAIVGSPCKCSTHGERGVPGKRQSPWRSWGPGANAVPMAIVGFPGECSNHGECWALEEMQYPQRLWGP